MILSDKTIKELIKKGDIVIDPFDEHNLQPASYDLHMGSKIMSMDRSKATFIDIKSPVKQEMITYDLGDGGAFVLQPGDFILANIVEITGVNDKYVGRLEGKSSLARLGLIIHATAGFLDPGNCLRMTLEICNLNNIPIKIYAGMKIAQMAFEELDQPCEKPYGSSGLNSKYFGDMEVKESQMYKNFDCKGKEIKKDFTGK